MTSLQAMCRIPATEEVLIRKDATEAANSSPGHNVSTKRKGSYVEGNQSRTISEPSFEDDIVYRGPLIKIGNTVNVKKRIKQLKRDYGLSNLEQVYDRFDVKHRWYEQVEKLA
ncbi:hypothetical protein G7Y89_g12838 [Cudoniella acicularis]|uniref:Bacteriophage T5 Orf172 DNA-binding domain-containing protein n=1 Tax=Cudoniella acicularis TaxID=354080 RepID=A0A8H4RB21_9HELO|nr:hypothetical protein G7Y89_g12838 [Cudoniella acicularis]